MTRHRTRMIRSALAAVAAVGLAVGALPTGSAGASVGHQAAGAKCPLAALKKAKSPGRDHDVALDAAGERGHAAEAH